MAGRHLTWESEGVLDSLECCGDFFPFLFLFEVISVGSCWAQIPEKERIQESFNRPGCRALPQQLAQENLLSQVQAETRFNAE